MKKIITIPMLLIIGLLTTSYIAPALAIPHGPFWDLGSVNNLGWGVSDIWTLAYGEDHKVYGGTSDGFAGSHFFVVDLQSNGGYYPLTLATAVTDLGNYNVEIFTLTPSKCTCLNWTIGDTPCGYPLAIYGGSYKASDGNGGHFFVFYTDPIATGSPPNFHDYGALWLAGTGNVLPAPGGPNDDAIINDLTNGKCGMIYGGTGYGADSGWYDWAYLFSFDPETETFTQIFQCVNALQLNNVEAGIHGEIYFTCMHPTAGSFWVYDPSRGTVTPIASAASVGATYFAGDAMTVDKDGTVYLGTNNGRLVRYVPGTGACGTGAISDLGQVIADRTDQIRGMTNCAWGLIYMGTHGGYFVVYDPRTAWDPAQAGQWDENPGNTGPVGGERRIRSLVTCSKYNTVFGGTGFNAHLFYYYKCTKDYNNDGVIDMRDIAPAAAEYGWHYTPPTKYCALGGAVAVALVILTVRKLKKR